MRALLAAVVFLGGVAAATADEPPPSAKCELRVIQALKEGGGIDPRIVRLRPYLERAPFTAWHEFKLLHSQEIELAPRGSASFDIPNGRKGTLTYVEHVLAAALLPWFFVTPILWRVATLHPSAQRHHLLLDILRFGNPVAPPIYAIRDALWSGHLPRLADVIYLLVAAAVAMALGALVFKRVDDRIAVEL